MRKRLLSGVVLSLLASVLIGIVPAESAGTLPIGFTDQFLFRVEQPTALAFTPDGRMLVTSRPGRLYIAVNGAVLANSSLDLRSKICFNSERGLLGVAVDPAFATNRYVYLFYTFKKFTGCPTKSASQPVNRVSRFVLPDNNVILPTSETVLIDNIPSTNGFHNAGDINFGSDNMLYVTVGDQGCGNGSGYGCSKPDALNGLMGKVLRVNRNGAAPADNPYQGSGSLPCATTGSTAGGTTCREIYAMGLRNPFRFAMDPNTPGRFYINDVGHGVWEEIDLGKAKANYGWPAREGHCAAGSSTNCGTPAGLTNPVFDYNHSTGCKSITAGAFVPNDAAWPASYLGKYLFADFICGTIFRLDPLGPGFEMNPFATGFGLGSIVHMEFGPPEPRRALYYTTFIGGQGEVRRIAFTSDGRPVAEMTAAPITGLTPLTVNFDGSASVDPEEEALTYHWDFGDGGTDTTSTPTTSHTYTTAGTYFPSLVVEDPGGLLSDPFSVRVVPGNEAPVPVITSPAGGATFRVGQTITLNGSATDAEDGTYPASALTWRVWLFHRDHRHPYFGPATGNGHQITGPAPEDLAAASNSYLIVELTVTDSKGISTTATRTVMPRTVGLTFKTKPTPLNVRVNGLGYKTPITLTSWAGWQITIFAPSPQQGYHFLSWSDNGQQEHSITTPNTGTTYTAQYVKLGA